MMITNFASGELGPQLNGRVDLPQYYQGASRIENFDVIPTGGITRRVGTERLKSLNGLHRLIPFILDADTSFLLALTSLGSNTTIRILNTDGTQKAVLTGPWLSYNEIQEIQYAQNYNTMIFVQENHTPYMLVYNAGTDTFTGGKMSFDFSPDVELDNDYADTFFIPVYRHGSAPKKTASGYLIAEGHLYKWDEELKTWSFDDELDSVEYDQRVGLFDHDGDYPSCVAFFNGRLFLASTRKDRQKVWASCAPDITGTRYNQFHTYVKYITVNKIVTEPDLHFFTASATKGSNELTDVSVKFTDGDDYTGYYVTGDNVPVGTSFQSATWDATTSKGTIKMSSAATEDAESAIYTIQRWRDRTTPSSSDYEYKVIVNNMTRADCAFFFEVASDQNDAIKWLASSFHLVIGTESSIYVMAAGSNATGQNVAVNGRNGTDALQATLIDRAVIYFSQGLKGIREYYWNNTEEAFRSNNIAMLAPQMLSESKAIDFDFMTNPYARILVTRADGTLAVLLYEKNSGVMAWTRIALAHGEIRSVAVTRGEGGCDIVYFVVYTPSGEFFLERLDMEKLVYLDSYTSFTGATNGYSDKAIIFNATRQKEITVAKYNAMSAEKRAAFYAAGDEAYIGYEYESRIRSMPVLNDDVTGKKRIAKLVVRFLESYRPVLQVEGRPDEPFTDFNEPFSGIKSIDYPGEHKRDVYFTLTAHGAQPCTVLAVNAILYQA